MTRFLLTGLPALVLLAALQACSFTTAHIETAVLARAVDEQTHEPLDETTNFHGSDAVLHCAVKMANTPSGTKVTAHWFAEADGARQALDSTDIELEQSGWVDFTLTLSQEHLPYGAYGVDLFIDGKPARTVPFTIAPEFPDGVIKEAVTASALSAIQFPVQPTKTFAKGTAEVFAPIYVSGHPEGTVFAARWYRHVDDGQRAQISSYELTTGREGWIGFSLNLPQGIPAGAYSVDVLVDGTVEHTLEFSAQ
ncbi:MAG: hypothetical protein RBU27_00265 [Bacteroidota bacterium]|jgi:hypothetical protein|nr:hypothetical protein [Bacteroidota bacterium]